MENIDQDRLDQLDQKIADMKRAQQPEPRKEDHYSQAHMAWRMVIELVVGLVIGAGVGYGLDMLFGTIPLFLIIFVLLGFAAGVKTMIRSARDMQDKMNAASDAQD